MSAPDGDQSDDRRVRRDRPFGIEREALTQLARIDLSPFVQNGSRQERAQVARHLRKTCVDIGFFYLVGHGIPESEFDDLLGWSHRFFELPVEEKMQLHADNNSEKLGYVATGGTTPGADPSLIPDLKERFFLNRELFPGEPQAGRRGAGLSQWPSDAVLPGFARFMKSHINKRVVLAQQLARVLALSLNLDETYFEEMFQYPNAAFVLNYYPPPAPGAARKSQWSFSPHTDYSAFTLLSQDMLGGLQVRNAAGDWIDVPPVAGAFVVNIGDLLATWTNDLYASTLHRAMNTGDVARISVPLFVSPLGTTVVKCLETCCGPNNPPRYEPVTAAAYVRNLLDEANRTGRPGIGAKTEERLRV